MKIAVIGGHPSPAFALIDELTGHDILFIGRKYALEGDRTESLEYRLAQEKNIEFVNLSSGRLQRSFTRYTLLSLSKIPVGFLKAYKILKKLRPDVTVGFGGYISPPVVFAAYLLKIPVVLHEQTLGAGLANRMLSGFARKICISWETSAQFFPRDKTVLTGIPLRREILEAQTMPDLPKGSDPLIYISGGSLGSSQINSLIKKIVPELLENSRIVHQSGEANKAKDFEELSDLRKSLSSKKREKYLLRPFFTASEAGEIMRNASLVVSRAGMNTVSELLYFKKPSLLIPLSISAEGEQIKNAQFLKSLGLAEVLNAKQIKPEELLGQIKKMMSRIGDYKILSGKAILDERAAQKLAKIVLDEAANKKTA